MEEPSLIKSDCIVYVSRRESRFSRWYIAMPNSVPRNSITNKAN